MNPIQEFIRNARRSRAPATVAIVSTIVVCFVVSFVTNGGAFFSSLAFVADQAASRPWTFLTYPLAYPATQFIGAVFLCLWLWGIGGSVEREIRTQRYVWFWLSMTLLGSLAVWAGSVMTGVPGLLWGAAIPTAATTVAWGVRNPTVEVRLMFVLPITGKWLAWIAAGIVFFGTAPQLAPFAAIPLVLAYFYSADKLAFLPWSSGRFSTHEKRRENKKIFTVIDNAIDRQKSREERDRLRKLFESSGITDEEEA